MTLLFLHGKESQILFQKLSVLLDVSAQKEAKKESVHSNPRKAGQDKQVAVLPRLDVHHRTQLGNLKQVASVGSNIGSFTNHHKSFQVFYCKKALGRWHCPQPQAVVPPQAAGAMLPAFMAPHQGGGAVASMVSGLYGQRVDSFQDLALADIAHMTYGTQEPAGTCMVITHAMGGSTGSCAFLTILPTIPGNDLVILVVHSVRQFIQPATDGTAATNDPLNNPTFAFI